jgi:hypothetical protein
MTTNQRVTKKPGPARWVPDLHEVRKLAELQCTYLEIAAFFGVSEALIKKEVARNQDFKDAIDYGKAHGAVSLRRLQWQLAMEGDKTMLIWLGKQVLGQSQNAGDSSAQPTQNPLNRFLPRAETIKE